jgi:SAM-dependent methyltransferase
VYGYIAGLYETSLAMSGIKRGVSRFLDRIDLSLPDGARLLDAGCGTGLISAWMLRRFAGAEIVAFDVDGGMLERLATAAARWEGAAWRLTIARGDLNRPERLTRFDNGRELTLAPESVHAIFVGAALEHASLDDALQGLFRLLRPGGILLNLGVRQSVAMAVLSRVYRFHLYPPNRVLAAFKRAGYADVRLQPLTLRDFPANLTRIAAIGRKP